MKKLLTVSALLVLFACPTYAQEGEEAKPIASQEHVENLVNSCKGYAQEDGVLAEDMDKYLLVCVNDDLEMDDYQLLDKLPPHA